MDEEKMRVGGRDVHGAVVEENGAGLVGSQGQGQELRRRELQFWRFWEEKRSLT